MEADDRQEGSNRDSGKAEEVFLWTGECAAGMVLQLKSRNRQPLDPRKEEAEALETRRDNDG